MAAYDVVVVGGAAMGSAAAYHLRRLAPRLSVAVVEREPEYTHCSTLRSEGNLRIQFNLEENVRMSQYSLELLPTFADEMAIDDWRPDLHPSHHGNLFLVDEAGRDAALDGVRLQRSLGCDVEWLDADAIAARWPQLGLATEAVVGGTHGPRDGVIDPTAMLEGFRRNAQRLGVEFLADEVTTVRTGRDCVTGVDLASGTRLDAPIVVVAAGGWSTQLAATAGMVLPVEPVMRTVHVVEHDPALGRVPSIFLPSGHYALVAGSTTTEVGWSTEHDPVGFDFTYRRAAFEERVWPGLVSALAGYDRLKLRGGWCGLYAMNRLDNNAILGEWPGLAGAWLACGFSGHGFQHTPAMGRYLAERIAGAPVTLDLSRLSPQRVVDGVPLREHAGRII